jgi:hypothetical protein
MSKIIKYEPSRIEKPARLLDVPSAWVGLESILPSIIDSFCVNRETAVDFGVDYGYSTVAFSNYFKKVIGVDPVLDHVSVNDFKNIELKQQRFEDFIANNDNQYDLIHVDIEHWFQTTYDCGTWAVHHAPVVLFHDTMSFTDVLRACLKIADENNMMFYNYPQHHGLGILVRK